MRAEPPTGRRPGRPPSLTRDDVARAALEEGVAQLSMPTVARRLGVGHSTLYRYVHDRDDLLVAALDLALREFEWPPADLGWRELLTSFADALWRFLEQYPGMGEASQVVPGLPARALDIANEYVTRLCVEGLSSRDAMIAIDFTADLVVAAEIGMRRMNRVFDTPRGRRSLRELYGGPPPSGSRGARRGWLDDKLAIMLNGLASRMAVAPAPPGAPEEPPRPVRSAQACPTREDIAAAGRGLARRSGLAAVSVRSVADELGVDASAVRRMAGDRDGVVVAMLDAVAADIVVPPPAPDPRAELLAVAMAGYAVLAADPWAVLALTVDGLAAPAVMPVARRVFVAFHALGVPEPEVAEANRVLWSHVYGTVLNQPREDTFARRVATSAGLPVVPTATPVDPALGIGLVIDGLLTHLVGRPAPLR